MKKGKELLSVFLAVILLATIPMEHMVQAEAHAVIMEETEVTVTETVENFSMETGSLVEEDLESDSIYATKRLIVLSDTPEFDTYEAESAVAYENIYVLSYATEKQCKKAYKKLSKNDNLLVEVDAVMETETAENEEKTDSSEKTYGSEKSGFTTKDTELKTYLDTWKSTQKINVAVLDTGVDVSKEVFKDRIVETDMNLSSSGEENSTHDDNGHGTAMAEIICESSNKVKIMPVKVANEDGKASILNVYQGILYAMENDADVINLSMNTFKSATSQILTEAIDEATKKGIVVVVSAGNDSINTKYMTPADVDSAIVIGAVNDNKTTAVYSNHGDTIDYVSYGGYEGKVGTSYATARVTGMIASLLSKGQKISILDNYVVDLGKEGWDKEFGNGFLSLYDYVEEEKEQENREEQKQPEEDAKDSTGEGSTEENESNTNTEVNTERKPAVFPEDAFESTIFDVDWKSLLDEKLNEILMNSEEAHMAVWLQNLSEEDLELVLSKQTFLTDSLITYGFEKDKNGKNIVDDVNVDENGEKQESYLLEETGSQPYYKYLLDIDFSEMSISEFENKNGYYTLEIVGGPKDVNGEIPTSTIRIKTTLQNKTIYEKEQSVTYAIVTGETTNKHSFKLRSTAGKNEDSVMGTTVPGQESDKSKSDGVTSYITRTNNVIWKSKTYGVYVVNGTYRQPAYTYPTGSVTSPNPTLRMNFQEYNWMNTGVATLRYRGIYHNDVNINSSNAHIVTMQVHGANAGQSCVPGVTGGHGTMRITLNYPTLTINYNKNGASINNSSSSKDLNISTTTTTICYDGSSKVDLINFSRFGLYQTGYHRVLGNEWNMQINGTGTSFNQDATYLATAFKDFSDGDRFENNTVTVYAQFEPNTLLVKYDANGGLVDKNAPYYKFNIDTYTDNWNYTTSEQSLIFPARFGLQREGWHIREGSEWNTKKNGNSDTAFNKNETYTMLEYASNLKNGNQTITMYAQWVKNMSTLKINPNGGIWEDSTTGQEYTSLTSTGFEQEYETTKYIKEPTTTDKYVITFDGNGGNIITPTTNVLVASLSIDSNKYFTGWTIKGNAGTFDISSKLFTYGSANGGTGTMTAKWEYGTVKLPDASRTGYKFKGWSKTKIGGAIIGENPYTPTGSIILYAQWEPNKSTLKINPNGGIWTDADTGEKYKSLTTGFEQAYGTIKTIPDAEKTNYTVTFVTYSSESINPISTTWKFNKWVDTASGNVAGDVDTAGTFIHDNNNKTGTFIYGANDNGHGIIKATWLGTDVITLPKPKREGFVFNGWYYSDGTLASFSGEEYKVTKNITLYAAWDYGYEISYDGNGATEGTMANTICISNQAAALSRNLYKKKITVTFNRNYTGASNSILEELTATFQGWGRDVDGVYHKYNEGALVYNWTTASGSVVPVEAIWSQLTVTPPTLDNRIGFLFKGWNEKKASANSGIVSVEAGRTLPVTQNITYYAVWEREKYDMTYHANDGTDRKVVDVKGKTYGMEYRLKNNVGFSDFERDGYTFEGWSTNPDTENIEYKQDDVFNGEGATDFYAVWKQKVNIIYNNQGEDNSGESIVKRKDIPSDENYILEQMMFHVERDDSGRYVRRFLNNNGEQIMNSDNEPVMMSFQGWSGDADITRYLSMEGIGKIYPENAIISQENLSIEFESTTEDDGLKYYNIFAIWDAVPDIEAHDVYISLNNAYNLTNEEFLEMAGAVVSDNEDPEEYFENSDNFYVLGGEISYMLSQFESDGILSVFLIAIDSAGNERRKMVNIHIVDTTPKVVNEGKYIRFISPKYADPSCRPEDGGLEDGSIWRSNSEYAQVLAEEMAKVSLIEQETKPITSMGKTYEVPYPTEIARSNAVQVWQFTKEDIDEIKSYVREHGPGNSKEDNALQNFLIEFAHCRIK